MTGDDSPSAMNRVWRYVLPPAREGYREITLDEAAVAGLDTAGAAPERIEIVCPRPPRLAEWRLILRVKRWACSRRAAFAAKMLIPGPKVRELDYAAYGETPLVEKQAGLGTVFLRMNLIQGLRPWWMILPMLGAGLDYWGRLAALCLRGVASPRYARPREETVFEAMTGKFGLVSGTMNYFARRWWRRIERDHLLAAKTLEAGIWDGQTSSMIFDSGFAGGFEYVQSVYTETLGRGGYSRYAATWRCDAAEASSVIVERFTALVAVNTAHYIPDIRAALRSFFELLEPGGILAMSLLGNYAALTRAGWVSSDMAARPKQAFGLVFTPDREELEKELVQAGFAILEIQECFRGKNAARFIDMQQHRRTGFYRHLYQTVLYQRSSCLPWLSRLIDRMADLWKSSRLRRECLRAAGGFFALEETRHGASPGVYLLSLARKPEA